jgi:nickel-dependent lactate racemase
MRVRLPSGGGVVEFDVPERNLVAVLSPTDVETAPDSETIIQDALERPVGLPSLHAVGAGKKSVVILVDDQTRPTPASRILPTLIARLGAGKDIKILTATGTHRPMTKQEIESKVGCDILRSCPVVPHEWDSEAALLDLGTTRNGTPVKVNRLVVEADLCVGIGNIVPHLFAGWAGGAKIVQPGVCGADTTYATHLLAYSCPFPLLGRLENPVRREIEDVARKVGLAAIVNTVLDREHSIVHIVAGEPEAAHRRGVELARSIWEVKAPCLADIVVVSAYPIEPNYWQSTKGLACAELLVKRGGEIILVSSCPEGLCDNEEHLFTLQSLAGVPGRELLREARRQGLTDYAALAVVGVAARCNELARVTVVSGHLSEDEVALMGHGHAASVDEALEDALGRQGADATISVITHGGDIVPALQ